MKNNTDDFWDDLPDYVIEDINKGLQEADSGMLRSHQEVMEEIRKKYNLNRNTKPTNKKE